MSFSLPEGITFRKEDLAQGFAYVFRHNKLGDLGRIVLGDRPGGLCQVECEVVGDPADPLTAKRKELFEPLGLELAKQLEAATGSVPPSVANATSARARPPEPRDVIPSKVIQCFRCEAFVAHLVFADTATDEAGLSDCARKMFPKIRELALPTWVIGAADGPGPTAKSPVIKVWPERGKLELLSPEEFNPRVEALQQAHCG